MPSASLSQGIPTDLSQPALFTLPRGAAPDPTSEWSSGHRASPASGSSPVSAPTVAQAGYSSLSPTLVSRGKWGLFPLQGWNSSPPTYPVPSCVPNNGRRPQDLKAVVLGLTPVTVTP